MNLELILGPLNLRKVKLKKGYFQKKLLRKRVDNGDH